MFLFMAKTTLLGKDILAEIAIFAMLKWIAVI